MLGYSQIESNVNIFVKAYWNAIKMLFNAYFINFKISICVLYLLVSFLLMDFRFYFFFCCSFCCCCCCNNDDQYQTINDTNDYDTNYQQIKWKYLRLLFLLLSFNCMKEKSHKHSIRIDYMQKNFICKLIEPSHIRYT